MWEGKKDISQKSCLPGDPQEGMEPHEPLLLHDRIIYII